MPAQRRSTGPLPPCFIERTSRKMLKFPARDRLHSELLRCISRRSLEAHSAIIGDERGRERLVWRCSPRYHMMNPSGSGVCLGGRVAVARKIPLFLSCSFSSFFLLLFNGAAAAGETAICSPPPPRCDLEPIRLAYSKVSSRSMIYSTVAVAAAPIDALSLNSAVAGHGGSFLPSWD